MPQPPAKIVPHGDRIRDLRLSRGMTQEKLARMSNVDVKTIYRAERGEAGMRAETLLDIATSLEVPIDELRASLPASAPGDASDPAPEGHGNLLLRRVTRASRFYRTASGCQHYSWSFHVDPDERTAEAMRELMQITKRAIEGPEGAADDFDREGEFSEPARVARLKRLIEELSEAQVSVLANRFLHVIGKDERGGSSTVVVLRVVFVEGEVERRREFADFEVPGGVLARTRAESPESHAPRPARAQEGAMIRHTSRLIEGVARLSFDERANSVMGALELALATLGSPTPYDELMGASGAAFRLQMALPDWCPSAPYAGVGFDCISSTAASTGRTIEWIPAEPTAPHPMQRRIDAIIATIDRGAPALYGAEECGLIVGYQNGGAQLSLRTYFDPTELYAVLDRLDWPSPGIIGERVEEPRARETLAGALTRAVDLARCEEQFPAHQPKHHYVCGFAAWEAWIAGLLDDDRFSSGPEGLARPIQANAWCYSSLIDARSAASRYLLTQAKETAALYPKLSDCLRRASALYAEQSVELEKRRRVVPQPEITGADDQIRVGYRMQGEAWPVEARREQADGLAAGLALERRAVEALDAARGHLTAS